MNIEHWDVQQVRVMVPAELGYLRMVRLAAAAFGDRLGFDVDEIEDIRVAVDELASCLIERASNTDPLTVVLSATEESLLVSGYVPSTEGPVLDTLTSQILGAVVNSYDTGNSDGMAWFHLRKSIPAV